MNGVPIRADIDAFVVALAAASSASTLSHQPMQLRFPKTSSSLCVAVTELRRAYGT
jgi:hypothetical protein